MKRKFIFLITLIFALGGVKSSLLNAQENEVTIGGDSESYQSPIQLNSKNSSTQTYYLSTEINRPNGAIIDKIAYQVIDDNGPTGRNVKVYLRNTEDSNFPRVSGRYYPIQMTNDDLVFDNTIDFNESGWVTIDIDNFDYTGSNLLVTVYDYTGKADVSTYFGQYACGSSSDRRSLRKTSTDPTTTPVSWTAMSTSPNITFTFTTDSGEGGEEEIQTPPTAANTPKLNGFPPSDYATYSNPTTLSWTWGENTTSYQVLVGTETTTENETTTVVNTLGQQEAQEFAADANSYTLNYLDPNTTYYWQVKSSNANGDTYSEVWQFTTVNADPTAMVTKTAPVDKASVKKSDLSFSWKNANTNHTRYTIYYKEDAATSEWAEFYSASSTDESYTPTESDFAKLEAGKTYLWKVNVNNAIYASEDMYPWSFTVVPTGNLACAVYNGDQAITATVELKEGEDVLSISTVSTAYFENITAGTYNLTVNANGFEEYIVKDVVIENGQTTNINIYMPTILDLDNGWINPNYGYTNGTLTKNNEVIVRANAIMPQQAISINTLTIEEGKSLTISDGATLTVTGKINKENVADNLIIEDGGQIFQTNEGVQATFNMAIINPTDSEGNPQWTNGNKNGWQFISSPFTDASINNFVTTGDGNDYDLYKFDGKKEGAEWQNQKAIDNTFEEEFVSGRGYLASYKKAATATLNGTLNTSTILDLSLSYAGSTLADLYLIGNPFPFDMDMSKLNGWTDDITEGYAVVNNGSYSYYNLEGTIPAGDGFFVKAEGSNAALYYNHNAKSSRSGNANSLNIIATGNAGNDNVVVNFNGEGEGFPKLQNFNDAIATVYVQNNDVNYAIFNCNEDVQEIELCFNANQMGNYTISVEPTGEFSSIVLVDRFTGIETNLLVEDYHFTAMSNENYNRFIIKLEVNGQQTTENSHFAYVSGEDLIFNVEGSVQIIDMMGRVVYTSEIESANNRINVSDFNSAAYVVRVVNENGVKVQKLIVNSL